MSYKTPDEFSKEVLINNQALKGRTQNPAMISVIDACDAKNILFDSISSKTSILSYNTPGVIRDSGSFGLHIVALVRHDIPEMVFTNDSTDYTIRVVPSSRTECVRDNELVGRFYSSTIRIKGSAGYATPEARLAALTAFILKHL